MSRNTNSVADVCRTIKNTSWGHIGLWDPEDFGTLGEYLDGLYEVKSILTQTYGVLSPRFDSIPVVLKDKCEEEIERVEELIAERDRPSVTVELSHEDLIAITEWAYTQDDRLYQHLYSIAQAESRTHPD